MRTRRYVHLAVVTVLALFGLHAFRSHSLGSSPGAAPAAAPHNQPPQRSFPSYKPTPDFIPPPIRDPFPRLLSDAEPVPPVPAWNRPRPGLHKSYGLELAPPLLIGFTRGWPLLLQTVVSYIAAGWPADQIYVIENTGVHRANELRRLTLQHPFFLNTRALAKLGVKHIRTPVRLTFAQLQNFFVSVAIEKAWPWFFWGHQDIVALSFEDGNDEYPFKYNEPGYRTIYELCIFHLNDTLHTQPRWGLAHFAYDHLALVNVAATEAIGGWDTLIPFYTSDCDFYSRLQMANYSILSRTAGHVTDVSSTYEDLAVLFRDPALIPTLVDPNPPAPSDAAPPPPPQQPLAQERRRNDDVAVLNTPSSTLIDLSDPLKYWQQLWAVSDQMYHYKHGDRGRNTWQLGQRGGLGEPYYYSAEGLQAGVEALTMAGRVVFAHKWGHRDCDLIESGLQASDAWTVEKDWEE